MGEKMTNHNLTAENLARRIRVQLAEFNDDNLSVQALIQLLVDFRRDAQRTIANLTQPAQAVDALELLAAEYELTGNWAIANGLRANGVGKNAYDYEVAIRAVARAITAHLSENSHDA